MIYRIGITFMPGRLILFQQKMIGTNSLIATLICLGYALCVCYCLNLISREPHLINGFTSMTVDPDEIATAEAACEAV